MHITIESDVQLFVDIEGASLVPDGAGMREKPTLTLLPGLASATCPVLVLAGEDDPMCPLQDALDIAAALPAQRLQLARFANAGHGTWHDQPEAAMARLRQFITDPV